MYGFNPKAMMEKLESVPPEKTFNRERSGEPLKIAFRASLFTPETGICVTSLKIIRIKAVIKSFFRILGASQILVKKESTDLSII
jgi:hypothetical protein